MEDKEIKKKITQMKSRVKREYLEEFALEINDVLDRLKNILCKKDVFSEDRE